MNDARVKEVLAKLSDVLGKAGYEIGAVSIDAKNNLTAAERDLLLDFQKRLYALQLDLKLAEKKS